MKLCHCRYSYGALNDLFDWILTTDSGTDISPLHFNGNYVMNVFFVSLLKGKFRLPIYSLVILERKPKRTNVT